MTRTKQRRKENSSEGPQTTNRIFSLAWLHEKIRPEGPRIIVHLLNQSRKNDLENCHERDIKYDPWEQNMKLNMPTGHLHDTKSIMSKGSHFFLMILLFMYPLERRKRYFGILHFFSRKVCWVKDSPKYKCTRTLLLILTLSR